MELLTIPNMADCSKERALLALMDRTSYNIVQENGQRRFGPPPNWQGPPPPKGCEVFVGKIPRELFEDELVPVFERMGTIYEMRLMMDFSGSNRGYAFVMYTNAYDAKRAIRELDNFEIRRNRFIGVCKSQDNCRLFVGGIPKNKTKEEILQEMSRVTDDVSDVILYSSFQDKTKNRGFAFVEYENHRAAAMARRKLIPGKILLWGQDIAVDWADPEPEVDEQTMSKVTVLYVRNLSALTTEPDLVGFFSLGNTLRVEKVKKLRDFAFVHYTVREEAEAALHHLNGACIDDSTIEVTWAKPADKSNRRRSHSAPCDRYGLPFLPNLSDVESLSSAFSNLNISGLSPSSSNSRLRTSTPVSKPSTPFSFNGYDGVYNLGSTSAEWSTADESRHYRTPINAVQILDEFCRQNNCAAPHYVLLTFDGEPPNRTLYLYKVFITGVWGSKAFVPDSVTSVCDEAKTIAAEYILKVLGLPTQMLSPWHSTTALNTSLPHGSHAVGTHPRALSRPEVDFAQGDVGSLSFPGASSLYSAAFQTTQTPVAESHDDFDTTHFFELHGLKPN